MGWGRGEGGVFGGGREGNLELLQEGDRNTPLARAAGHPQFPPRTHGGLTKEVEQVSVIERRGRAHHVELGRTNTDRVVEAGLPDLAVLPAGGDLGCEHVSIAEDGVSLRDSSELPGFQRPGYRPPPIYLAPPHQHKHTAS